MWREDITVYAHSFEWDHRRLEAQNDICGREVEPCGSWILLMTLGGCYMFQLKSSGYYRKFAKPEMNLWIKRFDLKMISCFETSIQVQHVMGVGKPFQRLDEYPGAVRTRKPARQDPIRWNLNPKLKRGDSRFAQGVPDRRPAWSCTWFFTMYDFVRCFGGSNDRTVPIGAIQLRFCSRTRSWRWREEPGVLVGQLNTK